jgi:hypothetical protein
MAWKVVGVRAAESSPERDAVAAAVVEVERAGEQREISVELASTAAAAGKSLNARDVVRHFLEREEPPKRLIVTTHGVSAARPA